jgi:GTP-binding protein
VVALNKVDTIDQELADALSAELEEACGHPPLLLSGATGQGVTEVLDALLRALGPVEGEKEEEAEWTPL